MKPYKEKYGNWAGNPAGYAPDYELCCEEVGRNQGRWTSYGQCTRKRGHGPDGAYCKIHDPEAKAARQAASDAAWREKANRGRYEIHGRTFFDALQQIADGHNDARGLAQEVIARFHAGAYK